MGADRAIGKADACATRRRDEAAASPGTFRWMGRNSNEEAAADAWPRQPGMSEDADRIIRFLAETPPFSLLPADRRAVLAGEFQVVRFRLGEAILTRQAIPAAFHLIVDGKV